MADKSLIKKYLPEDLWNVASNFEIPDEFLTDMPKLIEMVLRSKSVDSDEEKQNWFNLLPLMNNDQIEKLNNILLKEQEKLNEIEKKYDAKKDEIKKKYLLKWQEMGYVKKMSELHDEEKIDKTKEEEEAEKLLEMI